VRRLLPLVFAAVLLLGTAVPSTATTVVVQRVWHAYLGTHGRAYLTAMSDGTGHLAIGMSGLRRGTPYAADIYSGRCGSLGTRLARWTVTTGSTGALSTTRTLTRATMNRIWGSGRTGNIAFRVVYGTSTVCGNLSYWVATRIRIPSYRIDLPVVRGPSSYPYCNVAMHQPVLWQPTEPGVTFIYAHARTGMFLPLLSASKVSNGAAMIGRLVYVYTSNSQMYTYRIFKVWRHVTSVQSAVGVTSEQLWLQTSEGPNFTYPKLIVEARRIATTSVSYSTAHPTPHIVHCS